MGGGGDEDSPCAFLLYGCETGQRKGREVKTRKHRRDFDLQSQKNDSISFSCQWKLEGIEMLKGWFILMRKAIEQQ